MTSPSRMRTSHLLLPVCSPLQCRWRHHRACALLAYFGLSAHLNSVGDVAVAHAHFSPTLECLLTSTASMTSPSRMRTSHFLRIVFIMLTSTASVTSPSRMRTSRLLLTVCSPLLRRWRHRRACALLGYLQLSAHLNSVGDVTVAHAHLSPSLDCLLTSTASVTSPSSMRTPPILES